MSEKHEPYRLAVKLAWRALLLCVLVTTVAIRLKMLSMPLERDEGEYAYAGQLILDGVAPYQFAYSVKFPGTYLAYAMIMAAFGQNAVGIHAGLLLVNSATVAIVFLLGRRLSNEPGGIAAASSYAILSISPWVAGLAAHATQFAMLPVLGGVFLLLFKPGRLWRVATAAMLLGLAVMMKQPALIFVCFGALYLFYDDLREARAWKEITFRNAVFIFSAAIPFIVTCAWLGHTGTFAKFWFWTFDYAREYGGLISPAQALAHAGPRIVQAVGAGWPFWLIALLGLVSGAWSMKTRQHTGFLAGFLACSIAALSVGFYFREHYFIFVLPAISLLVGTAVANVIAWQPARRWSNHFPALGLLGVALAWPLYRDRHLLFDLSPEVLGRTLYSPNPFLESLQVADYINRNTTAGDKIVVIGSEPQIYFYSHRLSATGYIYTYPLMEPQKYAAFMESEMIREIERNRPKYLILVAINESWLRREGSRQGIFTWANDYCAKHYTPTGLINIVSPTQTDYFFDKLPETVPKLDNYILIYKLNPSSAAGKELPAQDVAAQTPWHAPTIAVCDRADASDTRLTLPEAP